MLIEDIYRYRNIFYAGDHLEGDYCILIIPLSFESTFWAVGFKVTERFLGFWSMLTDTSRRLIVLELLCFSGLLVP